MNRIWRLLKYSRPYALYSLASVVLMAVVSAMAALRIYLIKPIFEKVLDPQNLSTQFLLLRVPGLNRQIDLLFLVPSHFQNGWTVVAYALVALRLSAPVTNPRRPTVGDQCCQRVVTREHDGVVTRRRSRLSFLRVTMW